MKHIFASALFFITFSVASQAAPPQPLPEPNQQTEKSLQIRGTLYGLIERYFDVCQPWRNSGAKLQTLLQNGFQLGLSDDATISGQIAGEHMFDDIAGENGKDAACKGAWKFLKNAGIQL